MRGMNSTLALVGAVGLVSLGGFAEANTSGPHDATQVVSDKLTDFTNFAGLSFPKFNASLGELTKVTLTLSGSMQTQLTCTAETDSSRTKAETDLTLWVKDPANLLTVNGYAPSLSHPQIYLTASENLGTVSAGDTVKTDWLTDSRSQSQTYTSFSILNEFKGPGTITLNVSSDTYIIAGWGGGNGRVSDETYASVTGTVTYEYSSVPEATTLLLGMAAGGPLLMHRGRRVRKTA